MAIIKKDGFDFFTDLKGNPDSIILKYSYLSDVISYIKENRIISVSLAYFLSGDIQNLNFLKEVSFIEKFSINDPMNLDIADLYALENLKYLTISVTDKKQYLDYTQFKNLEYLSIDWYNHFPDLTENINLKELSIWKFRPKHKSFDGLKLPLDLENFQITESNVLNFNGLNLRNLISFEGHYCSKLENFEGLEGISNNLNILVLDYCRKLVDYEKLDTCKDLQKLILGNCGDIPSLSWLKSLHKVKHFSFWNTKLIDGDVSPCFGIDYVSFKNSKSYNYKEEEFKLSK